jgi:uncharacterized membrane protein YhhN
MLGHVCTTIGLTPSAPPATALGFLVPTSVLGALTASALARAMRNSGNRTLIGPVLVYVAVLSVTLAAALTTLMRPEWSVVRRTLIVVGVTLFAASDAMLAWDRFARDTPSWQVRVMVTYHFAQMAIASSLALW